MKTNACIYAMAMFLTCLAGCATVQGPPPFPENPQAAEHYNLGNAHLRAGHYELAVAEFQDSLAIESEPYICHVRLGLALYGQGHFIDAADQFRHACESWGGPGSAGPLCTLQAITLQRAGETDAARRLLEVWTGADVAYVGGAGQWASTASGRLPSGWWKKLGKYLLGEMSEEKVLDVGHADVGYFSYLFVGIENVISGDLDKAQMLFGRVLENVAVGTWRHDLAVIELRSLNALREARQG